jgi:L-ascorbate metabolism protein UlaG (beta-lactamase superfamily)
VLAHPDPALYFRGAPRRDARLRLTYLGTAGFIVQTASRIVVIDPYVTRPGMLETLFGPLESNVSKVRSLFPRADEVLVGHAHYDHVLDAPEVCRQTGARLIGSPDVANVGRAAGLPEAQIVATSGREDLACGACTVRGLPSRHGRVYGRVPLPGSITSPPPWPPRFWQLPHGLVLSWWLEADGVRVVHVDSADFIDDELQGLSCDVLCLCAIGRQYRPGYTADIIRLLRPKIVIPCHWDVYTTPLEATPYLLPGVDLPGFVEEIRAAGAEPVVLPLTGTFGF